MPCEPGRAMLQCIPGNCGRMVRRFCLADRNHERDSVQSTIHFELASKRHSRQTFKLAIEETERRRRKSLSFMRQTCCNGGRLMDDAKACNSNLRRIKLLP